MIPQETTQGVLAFHSESRMGEVSPENSMWWKQEHCTVLETTNQSIASKRSPANVNPAVSVSAERAILPYLHMCSPHRMSTCILT